MKSINLTSENIKCCLLVLAVVAIEDVADYHGCLPHCSITNQHEAQLLSRSAWFIDSLTNLCHHLYFTLASKII